MQLSNHWCWACEYDGFLFVIWLYEAMWSEDTSGLPTVPFTILSLLISTPLVAYFEIVTIPSLTQTFSDKTNHEL